VLFLTLLPLQGSCAAPAQPDPPLVPLIVEDIDEPVFGSKARIFRSNPQGQKAVILVHGLNGRGDRDWREQFDVLSQRFQVISFDLPGFGASASRGEIYSPQKYAEFVDFVARRYANPPFHVVGHSLGGAIALLYAGTWPQNVDRLVLVDSAGVLHRLAYAKFLSSSALRSSGTATAESIRYVEDLTGKVLEELERVQPGLNHLILGHVFGTASNAESAEPTAIATLTQTDFSNILSTIKAPTLVVWGEEDLVTPLRTGYVLARRIPDAKLAVLSGVGHMPMLEDPQRFNALLVEHLVTEVRAQESMGMRRDTSNGGSGPSPRRGVCRSAKGMVFEGPYLDIEIRNCADITLRNVSARKVVIFESRVDIVDSDVTGDWVAVDVVGSDVRITATDITGQTAVQAARSRLDVAGSRLTGRGGALVSRGGVKAIFSVSEAEGAHGHRYLHGYFALPEGQQL